MKKLALAALLLTLPFISSAEPATTKTQVNTLFTHDLDGILNKEGLMLTVDFPPGAGDPIHKHDANVFVYVLEGKIEMQVKGKKPVILAPGDTFYESPSDIHLVGRNASKDKPAKMVVFFVKNKGEAPVQPVDKQ